MINQLQIKFIQTNYFLDLEYLSRKELTEVYKNRYFSYIDNSIISKIINSSYIQINNKKCKLNILLPKKSLLHSFFIKNILLHDFDLKDIEIKEKLYSFYNIDIPVRTICYLRNKYFIPNYKNRKNYLFYSTKEKLFSKEFSLIYKYIDILDNRKGVYEILNGVEVNYPNSKTKTIYIGSSKDMKKRLSFYIQKRGHNILLNKHLNSQSKIFFRYIENNNYKDLEMLLLDSFIEEYGSLPKLNIQRIFNI